MANIDVDFDGGSADDSDNESSSRSLEARTSSESPIYVKLSLPEHIVAYIENKQLLRETEEVECDNVLKENVMNNYLIVKRILSNLCWQDKLLCKHVCTTWHSAVLALQKEQLSPTDFLIRTQVNLNEKMAPFHSIRKLEQSGEFHTEPLVVFTFINDTRLGAGASSCDNLLPHPCDPPCENLHCWLDYVQNRITAPKDCILSVRARLMTYKPVAHSNTYDKLKYFDSITTFLCGIYIPVIPDVKFHVINITTNTDMQKNCYDAVSEIAQDRQFKGILVYVTEKFANQSNIDECDFLNYFKKVQPDMPYALGGCIVVDTLEKKDIQQIVETTHNEGQHFVSENLITLGMFTVPKSVTNPEKGVEYNFDMYSLVIESADGSLSKIQKTINEFSKKVPRFEHSIAVKLACVGRDLNHAKLLKIFFRAEFPNTRIIGCFGKGVLGINHPACPPTEPPPKKHRLTPPPLGLLHSYSAVYVYIGWGKMTTVQS